LPSCSATSPGVRPERSFSSPSETRADRCELERVRSAQRLAAREDEDRARERLREILQRPSFIERQLRWMALALGARAAMPTGERAGARELPGDDEWRPCAHRTVSAPFIPAFSSPGTEQENTYRPAYSVAVSVEVPRFGTRQSR